MDLNALRNADFKLLDDAVEDWAQIVRRLVELSKDAESGLHQAANKARWEGVNSQVTKEFIGKTAGEIKDAHTQASSIHGVLSDTAGELHGYQRQLDEAIQGGLKKNLTVLDTGNGSFTVTMNVHPDRAASGHTPPDHTESDVTALRDQVQGILRKATESDNSAYEILAALASQTNYGFGDANYKDRDEAAAALKEAADLAALAKKEPGDLSTAEFDRLNAGLAKYANDPLFAEKFATTLGPKGTLEFWAGINDPYSGRQVLSDRVEKFDDLQRNLGMTLAQATQIDSADMTVWKDQMIALGDQPVGKTTGVMGFQVMSNLMRAGDYDDQFLKSYGTALMATERRLTGNGEHGNVGWRQMGGAPLLNRMGDDNGVDPLTGYLKALSNSPDAATDFFNEKYVSKDDSPFERETGDDDKKAKVGLSNFQYLFEERDWPDDGADAITGRNNLAMALEAATTGHPAGELYAPEDTPPHDAGQAKLFGDIVHSVSEDNKRLTDNGYMSDSMGQIASEYLPDINRAMTDVEWSGTTEADKAEQEQIRRLFPITGTDAQLDHREVSRFLMTVGQNPEGYAAVEVQQKDYMANLMDYHLDPNLPADQRHSNDMALTVKEIAHGSGEISGTMAVGRQEAVAGPADEDDKKFGQSTAQWKNAVSGGIGTGIGVGTAFIATPVVGAVVGGAAGTASSMVLEAFFQDVEGQAKDDAGQEMGEYWSNSQKGTIRYAYTGAHEAAKAHQLPNVGTIEEYARTGARDGFDHAGGYLRSVAPELQTDI